MHNTPNGAAGQPRAGIASAIQSAVAEQRIAVTVQLAQALPHYDKDIWEVQLRFPDFGDWLHCGDIHKTTIFDAKGLESGASGAVRVEVDHEAVAKWFQRLSGLPMATLVRLSMADAKTVLREVTKLVGSLDSGN